MFFALRLSDCAQFHVSQHALDSFPLLRGRPLALLGQYAVDFAQMPALHTLQEQRKALVFALLQHHFVREIVPIFGIRHQRGIESQHILASALLGLDHALLEKGLQRLRGHTANHSNTQPEPERIAKRRDRRREGHIAHDVAALRIRQSASPPVAHPDVDATTPGVDEQDVLEAELFGENIP